MHNVTTPGLRFLLVEHDAWCPGSHGRGLDCVCNANTRIVSEDEFAAALAQTANRRQRREAAKRARRGRA